jgi:transposase
VKRGDRLTRALRTWVSSSLHRRKFPQALRYCRQSTTRRARAPFLPSPEGRGLLTEKDNRTTTAFRISDELWAVLQPLLPVSVNPHRFSGGRPRVPDRTCADAIFYVLRTGCQWQATLLSCYHPAGTTATEKPSASAMGSSVMPSQRRLRSVTTSPTSRPRESKSSGAIPALSPCRA